MGQQFPGFSDADFDAYQARKWASNRFNLERMRTREKLEALAQAAVPADLRDRLGVQMRSSHDHPTIFNNKRVDAQWVYFARSDANRKKVATIIDREHPLHQQIGDPADHHLHAVLALRLHEMGLDLLAGIHRNAWLDLRNLAARLAEPYESTIWRERLAALPEEVQFVPPGAHATAICAREVELDALRGVAAGLRAEADGEWILFRCIIDRADPRLGSSELASAVGNPLRQLAAIYDFAAWSPDHDYVGLQKTIRTEKKVAKAQAGAQASPIEPKCQVKITHGLFAGRQGVVLELDGKGSAKLMVGQVPVKVKVSELQRLS